MRTLILTLVLCTMTSLTAAQPRYFREQNFFGIPDLEELNDRRAVEISDSAWRGFFRPMDFELLQLSPSDFRLLVLDIAHPYFTLIRINTRNRLQMSNVSLSGDEADSLSPVRGPIDACQIKSGRFFNPETDRLAVVGAFNRQIGLFRVNSESSVVEFERFIDCPEVQKPIGVLFAAGSLFVTDETQQKIVRLDSLGNYISSYGGSGISRRQYQWLCRVDGFEDATGTAHLYTADARHHRIDHLTANRQSATIQFHSQTWCRAEDDYFLEPHDIAVLPRIGVFAWDMFRGNLMFWPTLDSLRSVERSDVRLTGLIGEDDFFWLKPAGGRLVIGFMDSVGTCRMASFGLDSYLDEFTSPFEYPAEEPEVPTRLALYQNYPNPFNPNTEIRFDLPENVRIELKIFNTLGQLVTTLADEMRPAGSHVIQWNGRDGSGRPLASGLYIYQLKAGSFTDSKKMLLVK